MSVNFVSTALTRSLRDIFHATMRIFCYLLPMPKQAKWAINTVGAQLTIEWQCCSFIAIDNWNHSSLKSRFHLTAVGFIASKTNPGQSQERHKIMGHRITEMSRKPFRNEHTGIGNSRIKYACFYWTSHASRTSREHKTHPSIRRTPIFWPGYSTVIS